MAIGYEPMQPMDEKVYQSYGAAMAREKDRDFALRAGAQAQQSAHQSSQLAQQDEHFTEQQRQQAGLAREHMNQQAAMQDSQQAAAFAMQHDRQNFEFTQADNLQLQKLNQDAASWQQLHDSGDITDDEFARGQTMIRNRQMPFQAQRDATEMRHRQKQNALLDEQSAREATREAINARHANGTAPEIHTDEDGNQFLWRPTGWEQLRPQTGGGHGQSGEVRPMTAAQTAGFRRSAETSVARDPAFMGKPPAEIAREVERRFRAWTTQPGAENLAPPRPITMSDNTPLWRLPEDQATVLRSLNTDEAALLGRDSRLTREQQSEVRTDMARFRELFRQFGTVDAMPPQEREEFLAIARTLDHYSGRRPQQGRPGAGQGDTPASAAGPAPRPDTSQFELADTRSAMGPAGSPPPQRPEDVAQQAMGDVGGPAPQSLLDRLGLTQQSQRARNQNLPPGVSVR